MRFRTATTLILVIAGVLALLLSGCSHKPEPVPSYSYGKNAITLHVSADKDLNIYDGGAHTLLMVVYQMTDVNPFNKLAQYEDGLRTLLETKATDPGFVASQKYFLEPGESRTLAIDRAEKAQWVGVVAGFYRLLPGKTTKTFQIPYKTETKGVIFRKHVAEIQPLEVHLILGQDSIQETK